MEEGRPDNTTAAQIMMHPGLECLSFLVGTWKGHGQGVFPTISSFDYSEELHFVPSPNKPVIAYSQRTWNLKSGQPMHSESGYWRPKPDGSIEVVIAQSTGLVEVLPKLFVDVAIKLFLLIGYPELVDPPCSYGSYDAKEKVVNLKSELVGNASKVKEITRGFRVHNGELCYVVEMATQSMDLQTHLKASLKRL